MHPVAKVLGSPMTTRTTKSAALVAVLAVLVVLTTACESRRGPDPTRVSVESTAGPFAIATTTVSSGNGFGGGTIYYPTSTAEGRFGGVAIAPGFTKTQSSIAWYGPRLASQGFVVFTIDTNSGLDFPASRGDQLLAALDFLTSSSSVKSRVDANRLAVMGWSMGGGGALEAAKDRPALKAAIPLAGWNTTTEWSSVTVPTLVVACENDSTAPVASHSRPFYDSLTSAQERAFVEMAGAPHGCVTSPTTAVARWTISWLKRFVDGDTRYTQFLCPPPADSTVSTQLTSCPM
ncbi:MAG: Triacylglycerol lipase [Acidimicrobiales bacterium]|nr:Triacylglycerol lipase [Acidimicrobiales bacterium]